METANPECRREYDGDKILLTIWWRRKKQKMCLAIFRFPYDVIRLLFVWWLDFADVALLDSVLRLSKVLRCDYESFLTSLEIDYWHIPQMKQIGHYQCAIDWLMARNLTLRSLCCDVSLLLNKNFPAASLEQIRSISIGNITLKDGEKFLSFVSNSTRQPLKSLETLSLRGCSVSHNRPIVDDWYIARLIHASKSLKELKLENIYIDLSSTSSFAAALLDSAPQLTSITLSDVSDELFVSLFITSRLPLLEKVKILSRLHRSVATVSSSYMENQFQQSTSSLPNLRSISAHSQLAYYLSFLSSNRRKNWISTEPASDLHFYVSLPPLQMKLESSHSESDKDRDNILRRFIRYTKSTAENIFEDLKSLSMKLFYEKTMKMSTLTESFDFEDSQSTNVFEHDHECLKSSVYESIQNLTALKLSLIQLPIIASIWSASDSNPLEVTPLTYLLTSKFFILELPQYLKHLTTLDLSIHEPLFVNDEYNDSLCFIEKFDDWTSWLVKECKMLEIVCLINIPVNLLALGKLERLRILTMEMDCKPLFVMWYAFIHHSLFNIISEPDNYSQPIFDSLYQFCWTDKNLFENDKNDQEEILRFILLSAQRLRHLKLKYLSERFERKCFTGLSLDDQKNLRKYFSNSFIDTINIWLFSYPSVRSFSYI